jgi:hypothetical protein
MISIDDYPQLALLAWNRKVRLISEEEALALYESNSQWVDRATMDGRETALLDRLIRDVGRERGMAGRAEHRRVLSLFSQMDAPFLRAASCWFAGDTAISLRCGEFRVSNDVDFLCASQEGYRALRERWFHKGFRGFFKNDIDVVREAQADRYGIRAVLRVDGAPLKVEIVSEGRISLSGQADPALPVDRLTDEDLVAEKLLANADRFLDDAALSRDALDLTLLAHQLGALPQVAWEKARAAYGDSVDRAFERALQRLRDRPQFVDRVLDALDVSVEGRAVIEARLEQIEPTPE